ncbi:PREDICTED: protein hinderin-like [Habropoda laboriosa]|uniref:protein hinderin-like n=1 Tax=Habropoda laboriosa TaxID=597456 RepID=UPI00083E1C94|nr:PREDICTED: protein hinderin-like [Habropoda laboriosa]
MYSNDYDDGRLMNSYIKWSKRQTISTESEEVKADEEFCWKCRGETADAQGNTASFPHIQDLCPADRRRIAQLVKQLIKCTKEMRDAKSELAVSESEKEAMRNQYQNSLDRRETERKQLEFQLTQSRSETQELKSRISQVLELLTRQIATQEKQFLELTETVRDLVKEKSRLQNALVEKQTETDFLQGEFERTKDLLQTERLHRYRDVTNVDRACQTVEPEVTAVPEEFDTESIFCRSPNARVKSKIDLEEASTEGTLLRELFFRKPSVEESGTLDIIPVLSESDQQMKRSSSRRFT